MVWGSDSKQRICDGKQINLLSFARSSAQWALCNRKKEGSFGKSLPEPGSEPANIGPGAKRVKVDRARRNLFSFSTPLDHQL